MEETPTSPYDSETSPHKSIGPYKILDVLGEGGMGTVYLAEQKEPVRRRVALKLIRLGMAPSRPRKRSRNGSVARTHADRTQGGPARSQ